MQVQISDYLSKLKFQIILGVLGSALSGFILDKFRIYKFMMLVTYLGSLLSMVLFTLFIMKKMIIGDFIATLLCGFFMATYWPVAFQLAVELCYPQSEGNQSNNI